MKLAIIIFIIFGVTVSLSTIGYVIYDYYQTKKATTSNDVEQ